ncbi:increased glyphosate resistance protein [Gluconobacter frateurii NBRC 103465]|nr:increased glyphosate resistance protein [Gluconobacter frateurii NBRC 103465]
MRQTLTSFLSNFIQCTNVRQVLFCQHFLREGRPRRSSGALRNTVQVFVSQKTLSQRRKGNTADTKSFQRIQKFNLYPAIQEGIRRLMDKERNTFAFKNFSRLLGSLRTVRRYPNIECLALAVHLNKRSNGFFQRNIKCWTVGIEDIHVFEPHALETLIKRSQQIFARASISVGPWPHIPSGFGRDDHFITIGSEIPTKDFAKIFFG